MSLNSAEWVHIRSPFVYWAQTEKTVSLRVDIRDAQNPRILIENSKVTFDSTGYGAQGENEYHFELALPHNVDSDKSTYRVSDRDVDILLIKKEHGWWSKVTTSPRKPAWLKVDFDRWKSPDDEDEIPSDVMKDFPDIMDRVQKEEYGYKVENLRKVYLFLYNLFQFVGYLFIVGVLSVRYLRDGQEATHRAYEFVGFAMRYCQTMQALEIIHPLMGFTKTSVPVAFLQIGGRALILFGIVQAEERLHDEPAVFWLFFFWSLAEVFRYPFYMLQIYERKVYFVTWLRYSAWIFLYPLGITSECVVIFSAITYFVETGRYSVTLPNSWNFSFSFPTIMRLYLLFGVFPVSYALICNMWRSRTKVLGKSRSVITKQK
ncbi:unnamed protein product [Orchesella dallaii]|uniref:Very-long-chain (3R)-3-hydroxyacyl-CoA dehydratase n=1 Tax=Orchesella dallaii TaxID=48710 RepID=A0ABP1Q843_9HEXA